MKTFHELSSMGPAIIGDGGERQATKWVIDWIHQYIPSGDSNPDIAACETPEEAIQHLLDAQESEDVESLSARNKELYEDLKDSKASWSEREFNLLRRIEELTKPIPLILTCPICGARHIDKGEFAIKVHHTHSCQRCGMTWRPAIVATVGVQFLPGFKDEDGAK